MTIPSGDSTNNGTNGAPPPGGGAGTPGDGQQQQPGRPSTADLQPEVLKVRLDAEAERGARREREALFTKYGVKSEEELAARLARLGTLEESDKKRAAEDEERKRATMTNEQRLQAECDQLKAKVAELEGKLQAANGKVAAMKQGQVVRAQFTDLIDPELLEEAELRFAAHVKSLREAGDTAALAKFDKPGEVRAWARDLVQRKPKFARAAAPAGGGNGGANGQKPSAARKPITTGASPARATPPAKVVPAATAAKTVRPGQKNSMSDAEVSEHLKAKYPGVRIPGMN